MEHLPLRKPQIAALKMQRFWLDEFHFVGSTDSAGSASAGEDIQIKVSKPNVRANPDDPSQYFVRLRVKASKATHSVDVTASALFTTDEPPDEKPNRLVQYNAPSILYGVIRGVVSQLTGSSDSGRIDLPSINIVALVDS